MYLICQFAINKSQNGYLSPAQFNTIINQGQTSYQNYLLGEFQQYQYGKAQARIGYSQNENIRQRLSPLIAESTLTVNGNTGQALYPSDFIQVDTLYQIVGGVGAVSPIVGGTLYTAGTYASVPLTGGKGTGALATVVVAAGAVTTVTITNPGTGYYLGDVLSAASSSIGNTGSGFTATVNSISSATNVIRIRYTQQDSLYSFYNSTIDPIATNPVYLIKQTGFQFYPSTLGPVVLTYIKNAPTMTWAYTLDANGRPVYAPTATGATVTPSTGTVQPVWDDVDLLEIIARALKLVGLNLQMGQIQQYANQITQQGQ